MAEWSKVLMDLSGVIVLAVPTKIRMNRWRATFSIVLLLTKTNTQNPVQITLRHLVRMIVFTEFTAKLCLNAPDVHVNYFATHLWMPRAKLGLVRIIR